MKHAKILPENEHTFDWEEADKALDNVQREDGSINWRNAFSADPGCSKCPGCGEYFWAEAKLLECTECGTQWNTHTKEII